MRFKITLCYVKKAGSIEKVSRHFLTEILAEEEIGELPENKIREILEEELKDTYIIRDPSLISRLLKELGYGDLRDKIVVEIVLKKCKE